MKVPSLVRAAAPSPSFAAAAIGLLVCWGSTGAQGAPPPTASAPAPAPASATEPATDAASTEAPAGQPSRVDEQVRAYLRLGQKAFAAGRFAEAEEWFEQAFEARPGYDVASNLGAAEHAQAKHREAATHLAFALRAFPATADPDTKRAVEQQYAEASGKVGAVRLAVSADGAEIIVAGQPMGKSPAADPIFVDPGTVSIEARLGERRASRSITLRAGEEQQISLDLGGATIAETSDSTGPVVAGVGFGLGGVGLVVAVVLTIVADGKTTDARALEAQYQATGSWNPEVHDAFASADSAWNAASALWIASGAVVLGATIATAALFGRDDAAVEVAPVATAGSGGLLVRGRF